nr:Wadjet anti-phage system protein JetD domain-containing protein [Sedimenticola hydrogenitrophicus]
MAWNRTLSVEYPTYMTQPPMHTPPAPPWLQDEPEIRDLLDTLLARLDKKPLAVREKPPSVRLSAKNQPDLFRNDEASDRSWALLKSLTPDLLRVTDNPRRKPFDPVYAGATIQLSPGREAEAEKLLRGWLVHPYCAPYRSHWERAVTAGAALFPGSAAELVLAAPGLPGRSAQEVLDAFARIGDFADIGLTLRQLSAKCFWGHSKFLDSREDLLRTLFPGILIAPRPVLVQLYLSSVVSGVLFIENQDSYLAALAGSPEAVAGHALIYVSGFKGSAGRIRNKQAVSMHFHASSDLQQQEKFLGWWFSGEACEWPLWFWGDLDYSGMMILKALRGLFGEVGAWVAGYSPMLDLLSRSQGHAAETANKGAQGNPESTGCDYADKVLLPAIRSTGMFVDQEAVTN